MTSHALVAGLVLVAAVNAPRRRLALSVADRRAVEQRRVAAAGALLLAVSLVLLALSADPLLDALDVSAPNARIAAGLVAGVAGLADLVTRRPPAGSALPGARAALVPIWFPVLLRPEVGLVTLSLGADHGVAVAALAALAAAATVVAAVVATGARAPRAGTGPVVEAGLGRVLSGVQVAGAVSLILWGVFDV